MQYNLGYQNQQLIYEYQNSFVIVGNIIKDDDQSFGFLSSATGYPNFRMLTFRIRRGTSLTMRD